MKNILFILISIVVISCNSGTTPTQNNGVTINQVSQIVHDSLHQLSLTLDVVYGKRDTTYNDETIIADSATIEDNEMVVYRIRIINSEGYYESKEVTLTKESPEYPIKITGKKSKVISWTITKEEVISQ